MRCIGCAAEIAPQSKFCNQCGAAQTRQPGAPESTGAPPTQLARSDATLAGERRQLTLLFCDLVSSTEIATRFDPEDWHVVAGRYQRVATEAVTRFGGYVAKYVGDGLVVYFGYPQAHEDDPERAVRGGLAILDAIVALNREIEAQHSCRLAVRIGLHTGPVVVGEGGGREFEVFGDAPNLAARLQAVAAPDTVVISDATQRLTRGLFVVEDIGAQQLKGIAQAVRAYRVLQPTGWHGRSAGDGRTPLVGRDAELRALLAQWQQAQGGAGGAAIICGEPGLGKSRLVQSLRERIGDVPHTWLACRCTAFTQDTAFHPIVELMEQALGFRPADSPMQKEQLLEGSLAAAGLSDPDTVPVLLDFLSIPLDETRRQLRRDVQRERVLDTLAAWTQALALRQPLIISLEDLHWCDPSSLELLGLVIERSAQAPILVVATARPEFTPPWVGVAHVQALTLQRLDDAEARRVVRALQGDVVLSEEVVDTIVTRADGNPLYLEELTKALLESDSASETEQDSSPSLDARAIPATLQDSLTARLDRLSAAKQVAQIAAVLGREFPYGLLQRVASLDDAILRDALDRLVDAELLVTRAVAPELVYAFKHALLQDAAYQSVLKRTRQQLHARIAQTLEQHFADRAVREPEVVARHYDAAKLPEQAVDHYQRAAGQALVRSAHEEAMRHLRRALELVQALPVGAERDQRELMLQLALGNALAGGRGLASAEMQVAYERARALAEAVGDDWQRAPALWGLSVYYTASGMLDRGLEFARQLHAISERTHLDVHQLSSAEELAVPLYYRGEFSESLAHCERALEIHNQFDRARNESMAWVYPTEPGVPISIYAGLNRWQLGYPEQAQAWLGRAEELARAYRHPYSIAFALIFSAMLHWMLGDTERQMAAASEVITTCERHRVPMWLPAGKVLLAEALAARGECETALQHVQEAMETAARSGAQAGVPAYLAMQANVLHAAGNSEAALSVVMLGLSVAEQGQQHFWTPELLRQRGELLLCAATPGTLQHATIQQEAEQCFRSASNAATERGARMQQLRAATSLARLLQQQGRGGLGLEILSPIYGEFTEGFETHDLTAARALLAEMGASSSPRA